jgi:hypothetical protein
VLWQERGRSCSTIGGTNSRPSSAALTPAAGADDRAEAEQSEDRQVKPASGDRPKHTGSPIEDGRLLSERNV